MSYFYFIGMSALHVCMSVQHVYHQKRASNPLELELQALIGHVGAGNETPGLCKSSKPSKLRGCLSMFLDYVSNVSAVDLGYHSQ